MCGRGKAEFFTSAAGLLWQYAVTPYMQESLSGASAAALCAQDVLRSLDHMQNKAGGKVRI